MTKRGNLRVMIAALFFTLCLILSFAVGTQTAEAGGDCWICGGIDWCKSNNFGMTECDAVALEYCETYGNFCS